jgi:hypothetical protein
LLPSVRIFPVAIVADLGPVQDIFDTPAQAARGAHRRGHLDHLLPARSKVAVVEHHAALPYAELPRS